MDWTHWTRWMLPRALPRLARLHRDHALRYSDREDRRARGQGGGSGSRDVCAESPDGQSRIACLRQDRQRRHARKSLTQAINDLGAFPDHTTPEWMKLSSDVRAAQAKAQAARSLGNDLTVPVSRLDLAAQQLQADAATLAAEAHDIAAIAGDLAAGLQRQVANAMDQLQLQVGPLKDQTKHIGAQIDAARVRIGNVAGDAKANFDAALEQGRAGIAAKAAAAKAAAQAAVASAQQKLAAAESDYAELLGAQEIGLANQLPDGNATGAITQYGYYVIIISGTSG